jgi:hypothetical protein
MNIISSVFHSRPLDRQSLVHTCMHSIGGSTIYFVHFLDLVFEVSTAATMGLIIYCLEAALARSARASRRLNLASWMTPVWKIVY